MAEATTAPRTLPQILRRGAIALVALLMVTGILLLGRTVRTELKELATTGSDNIEWSLSQAEVEAIAFSQEALIAARAPSVPLDLVRLRFDLLYSRVVVLQQGPVFAAMRTDPQVAEHLTKVQSFLDETATLVDGPDAQLRASLPRLSSGSDAVRSDLRDIALQGIAHFSQTSDTQREEVARTLRELALLTLGLVVLLGVTVLALMRLNTVNHRVAETEHATRARLEAILTTALDAVIVTDERGALRGGNPAAERMFGYPRAILLTRTLTDLMAPGALPDGLAPLSGCGLIESEARHSDGTMFPIELSVSNATGRNGTPICVAFVRNIAERAAADAALRRSRDTALAGEQSKAELLAVMSHEMRTPLNGLLGTLDLMRREGLNDRMQRYAGIMERSGQLLLRHVEDVLGIAQAEAGQMAIVAEPLDLNALIAELVEAQAGQAAERGNQLNAGDAVPALARVWGDPLRLRQVLLNLIGNALKFTENGSVTVEAEALDDLPLVELRVIDTGIGITEANLARIFEDFVTLDASYRRTNSGTGLGLGIARRMVRAMGGEIGVESEPGEGSLFWIRLPLAPPTDAGSAPHGLRVLLVEDNQINRFVARGMLERDGHTVTEAIDGAEGLAAAERERFDLIVMDVSMPHLDGVSATRNIRSGSGPSAATPILGLTAHAQPAEVARFRAAGMTEVLHKPVLQGELTRMIARALGTTATAPGAAAASLPAAEETLPLIDPQISGELRDAIGAQSHAQLRDALVGEAKRFFTQPHEDVGHDAHRLAGSAAVLGARALHRHLQSVELAAADPATLPRSLELAAACWKDTLPLLLPEHADRH